MTFTITELRELINCIDNIEDWLVDKEVLVKIRNRFYAEYVAKNEVLEKQLEEDKLNHEMNFKNAYAKIGDY
jgi:hypothetical protein